MNAPDPRDDIAMIRRLMQQSQQVVYGGARYHITWGVIVALALLLSYAVLEWGLALPLEIGWLWVIALALGWAITLYRIFRHERVAAPVRNPGGRIVMGIWIGAGVAMTLIGIVGPLRGALGPAGLLGAITAVAGGAYFATSFVMDSRLLRYLSVGWWLGAVPMFLWRGSYVLLLMAAMVVLLQIVPAFTLLGQRNAEPAASTS